MRAIAKPHTHKFRVNSGKKQGNLPPPPRDPRNPEIYVGLIGKPPKFSKNQEKIRKKWGLRGVGGGREYRGTPQNTPRKIDEQISSEKFSVFLYFYNFSIDDLLIDLSGGILGWDPVLTTCILVREDNSQDITEMNKGPHHSHGIS